MARSPRLDQGQLQQILSGLSEGIIILDSDGVIVWANQTALALHECATVEELGASATGRQRKFILRSAEGRPLQPREYPTRRLMAGDTFNDLVVEVTQRRNATFRRVFRVRGLTFANEHAVESLVIVIHDVTALNGAEARFETTFAAKPGPALICRLSDLRYIKVNDAFIEMTGYDRDTILNSTIDDLAMFDGSQQRDAAVANLRQGHTIQQQEIMLRLPDNSRKLVVVAGQPIEIGGEASMLLSFNDLDAHRKTEQALRQSEERFSTIFRLAPLPMTVARLPYIDRIERNEAFTRTLLTSEDPRVAGSPLRQRREEAVRQISDMLLAGQSVRNFAHTWVNLEGEPVDFRISSELIYIGGEPHMLSVFEDVTERNRSEAELAAAINDVLRDASWFGRTVLEKLAQIQQPRKPAPPGLNALTQRELQVLGLICEGMSDAAIATRLGLSPNTVRNHVAALYGKMGVNRRSAAVVWGRQRGITGGGTPRR